ncbi:MAG: acyl-CoA/acyl-ACP dehydrogenase [Proteobacteria bacterium]|nr:acyl-CoA/acyl-ACP dehydrogenase [Pseudomonadota bacterium]MBU4471705.1 acyl-CoA/acyl-ACP dehydrogenase [Pseudomonadota bacterium]MCG2750679.1 acyl-CoA/acyl-ACP dehydrogenase [Desulfobacteraceae bacterium]
MDLRFSKDQEQIQKEARLFLKKECPMEYVREMFEDEKGFTDKIWTKMAELGWMGIHIPEEYGGIGLSLLDLCLVVEEMGRSLVPGPYFSTVVLAAELLIEAGTQNQKQKHLTKIAAGEERGTLALMEHDGGSDPGFVQMTAEKDGNGYILNGTKLFVPDAHTSDFIICTARTSPGDLPAQGITLFLLDAKADGLSITPLKTMDATRKQCEVAFKNVKVSPESIVGEVNNGWAPLQRVLSLASVCLCAENTGAAQKSMEIAVDYAKERHQFGVPIGAFQAIKHKCADMLPGVEGSRGLLYYAAWALEEEDPSIAALAAASAKTYSANALRDITTDTIQVLGGVGFTWEYDVHFYMKRAKANQVMLGDNAYYWEEMSKMLGY